MEPRKRAAGLGKYKLNEQSWKLMCGAQPDGSVDGWCF
jgi:hypothetical protein